MKEQKEKIGVAKEIKQEICLCNPMILGDESRKKRGIGVDDGNPCTMCGSNK